MDGVGGKLEGKFGGVFVSGHGTGWVLGLNTGRENEEMSRRKVEGNSTW